MRITSRRKPKQFKSLHNLNFETAKWMNGVNKWQRFRVGTCEGLWSSTDESYCILAVTNSTLGNGHFTDVLQWFENSCKRDKRSFKIIELWNDRLKSHLINKRGFNDIGNNCVEKVFK